MDILFCLNEIILNLKKYNCNLNDTSFIVETAEALDALEGNLGIDNAQACLLAVILELSGWQKVNLPAIATWLKITYTEALSLVPDIRALEEKGLIAMDENFGVVVPAEAIEAFIGNHSPHGNQQVEYNDFDEQEATYSRILDTVLTGESS